MRYLALVTDFDGVIAHEDRPSETAIAAIQRLRASGRRVVLLTGRRLEDLRRLLPRLDLFDCVVAENGAVFYEPVTRREVLLAEAPPRQFIERLEEQKVEPLDVGQVIVSTWLPNHTAVLETIRAMGLELHIVFNRAAVMALPAGITKATGMDFALRKLGLSRHEVVGVGDSENDHSFLERCELAATVANAVPSILQAADFVATKANGEGLAELIDDLIATDLTRVRTRRHRTSLLLGRCKDGSEIAVPAYGLNVLVVGPSGSGKSTVTAGIVERLIALEYQLCIVDPEGDYSTVRDVITLGNQDHAVTAGEALTLLEDPKVNLNVNLLGIPLEDRPEFFGQLFPNLQGTRTRTGRPHWIVLDEAHHLLPAEWAKLGREFPQSFKETLLVTVHPDRLSPLVLKLIDVVIAVGADPRETLRQFADAVGQSMDWPPGLSSEVGEAVLWFPREGDPPVSIETVPGSAERIRHLRKYAEGNMRHRSFFFRGPGNRLNLRAHNLALFAQIADGVDEETWLFHLRRGDYSRWFRGAVKDDYLAEQAERIERRSDLQPAESRRLMRGLIEARYTLPE